MKSPRHGQPPPRNIATPTFSRRSISMRVRPSSSRQVCSYTCQGHVFISSAVGPDVCSSRVHLSRYRRPKTCRKWQDRTLEIRLFQVCFVLETRSILTCFVVASKQDHSPLRFQTTRPFRSHTPLPLTGAGGLPSLLVSWGSSPCFVSSLQFSRTNGLGQSAPSSPPSS